MGMENKLEEKVPYELRFYAYFSKKINSDYREINTFWNERMEEVEDVFSIF